MRFPSHVSRWSTLAITLLCSAAVPGVTWAADARVLHTSEPENGLLTLDMEPLWTLHGDAEEYLFGVLNGFTSDDQGNVYLLDGQLSHIYVFSRDGEYLRTLGRAGEGPGEFRTSYDLYRGPGDLLGVVQIFPGKIVQLTLQGDPAGLFPLPSRPGGAFQSIFSTHGNAERVYLAGSWTITEEGQRTRIKYLKAFDAEGREQAHFHEERSAYQYGGMRWVERDFTTFQRRWAVSNQDEVAAGLDFDAYRIHVWDRNGRLQRILERSDHVPVARTAQEKQRFQTVYDGITSWNPGSSFEVSDTHEAILRLHYRDDGSLWVLPAAGMFRNPEGVFVTFDVFDADGRFVAQVALRGPGDAATDAIYLDGDRMVVVSDFYGAYVAALAADDAEVAGDLDPISVTAYAVRWPLVDRLVKEPAEP